MELPAVRLMKDLENLYDDVKGFSVKFTEAQEAAGELPTKLSRQPPLGMSQEPTEGWFSRSRGKKIFG